MDAPTSVTTYRRGEISLHMRYAAANVPHGLDIAFSIGPASLGDACIRSSRAFRSNPLSHMHLFD